MWLINTDELKLEEHFLEDVEDEYAILSHTWEKPARPSIFVKDQQDSDSQSKESGQSGEISFQEMQQHSDEAEDKTCRKKVEQKTGWKKVERTCEEARKHGLRWAWVDTCCIDKRSSAELSEAINSMYNWYKSAACCYVYMADVAVKETDRQDAFADVQIEMAFRESRWFKRGWTLQELLAPRHLRFYSRDWHFLGAKLPPFDHHGMPREMNAADELYTAELALLRMLNRVTTIPTEMLAGLRDVSKYSVAQRMSWASARETTRQEDVAYCLLGIFKINMPLLYGEGSNAFRRLQEQITRQYHDHSIFAWEHDPAVTSAVIPLGDLFARSPRAFAGCGNVVTWPAPHVASFDLGNRGLNIDLYHPRKLTSTGHVSGDEYDEKIAILLCRKRDDYNNALALRLGALGRDGVQYVEERSSPGEGRASRLTQASLQAEAMSPERRTTIALHHTRLLGNPADWDYEHLPPQLLVEVLVPGGVDITDLQPSDAWNAETLVMSLPLQAPYAHSISAAIDFTYNNRQFSICLNHGSHEITFEITSSVHRKSGSSRRLNADATRQSIRIERNRGSTVCILLPGSKPQICCALGKAPRLGRWIWVLQIRSPDDHELRILRSHDLCRDDLDDGRQKPS